MPFALLLKSDLYSFYEITIDLKDAAPEPNTVDGLNISSSLEALKEGKYPRIKGCTFDRSHRPHRSNDVPTGISYPESISGITN